MSRVCEVTGRKTSAGNTRSHNRGKAGGVDGPWSKKAQAKKRTWRPNLRKVNVLINGSKNRITMSMKAYKKLRKSGSINNQEGARITLA